MKKIIFFVTGLDIGGLENYLLRFLELYAPQFEDIIVFCRGAKRGVLENEYGKIEKVRIIKRKIGNYHPHHYFWLRNWFKRHQKYIVCDFTGNFSGPVLWAAKNAKISKRIAFYRSSSNRFKEDSLRLFVNSLYNILVYRYASGIYANSKYAFDFFFAGKILDDRFKVIYNGLDIEKFLSDKNDLREEFGIAKDIFVIGHTGRYNPAKNHHTILKVAFKVLTERKDVVFILCGKGVKQHLHEAVVKRGYNERILLFEDRPDISRFLNTCNAFFFPSTTEGQPNSLIEAWIKGLPFVASDIPPIKQLVTEEFDCYLINPYDIQETSRLLSAIVDGKFDEEKKSSLQLWAKETFDAKKRFEEFYQALTELTNKGQKVHGFQHKARLSQH